MENVDPDDVDALLTSELNAMSFRERETVYEEIHGVEKDAEETEEFLEEKLELMNQILQRSVHNRVLYERASTINREYVENRSFRLMFLRSEYYHPENAAERLVRFLEGKIRFFGDDVLARPICLTDFNEDDMSFLKSGILQIIPARDRSGRVILADFNMDPHSDQPKCIDSLIKMVAYTICSAAEDEKTQKRGMVGVFYFTRASNVLWKLHERRANVFDWLPLKIVGGHICFNDIRFRLVKALVMLVIGKERRVRVRMHEGSHTECQYKLITFGVPVNVFPVTYEGELKTASHLKWIARRKVKEAALRSVGTFEGIDLPSPKDVLVGRGKTVQDHTGNVMMHNLIAAYLPEYRRAPKLGKGQVAWKVVVDTQRMGGRFLKRDTSGWWVEVSDDAAREKISMTFRTNRSLTAQPTAPVGKVELEGTAVATSNINLVQETQRNRKRARLREESETEMSAVSGSHVCFGIPMLCPWNTPGVHGAW